MGSWAPDVTLGNRLGQSGTAPRLSPRQPKCPARRLQGKVQKSRPRGGQKGASSLMAAARRWQRVLGQIWHGKPTCLREAPSSKVKDFWRARKVESSKRSPRLIFPSQIRRRVLIYICDTHILTYTHCITENRCINYISSFTDLPGCVTELESHWSAIYRHYS